MDRMIIEPTSIWYNTDSFKKLPSSDQRGSAGKISDEDAIVSLHQRGDRILDDISKKFLQILQPQHGQKRKATTNFGGLSESDKSFINKIMSSGTSSDRLSALILLVSSAPLHSRTHLTTLLNTSKKKNREEAGRAIRALVDWVSGGGNPELGGLPNRKLKYFRDQPDLITVAQLQKVKNRKSKSKNVESESSFEGEAEGDQWLALWAFEDWLKKWYVELLKVIEGLSHDPLVFTRNQSVSHLFCLLRDKPEQEQNLLALLVNKLGDNERIVCSRTSYNLLLLLQTHPLMKSIIIREISALVLKPIVHQIKKRDPKSKKSPAIDLSIRHHDHARYYGAITLNQITLSKGDSEISNRLIEVYFEIFKEILGSAMSEEEEAAAQPATLDEMNEEEIEAEHMRQQDEDSKKRKGRKKSNSSKKTSREISEEEIVAEKRSRLIAVVLTGLNRAFPYGSLSEGTFNSHLNTLFRIIHTGSFNVSVQALILVQHLTITKPSIAERFYRVLYETLLDHRLMVNTSKHALYLNLLFKSLKADNNEQRVFAFVKRIIQILHYQQPSFICVTLVLLGELFGLPKFFETSEKLLSEKNEDCLVDKNDSEGRIEYDGRKRDPSFSNALKSFLWELVPLLSHYHPAVSLNASQLLNSQKVTSTVDFDHHTLSSFLDKFVYRQPKRVSKSKGSSIMQPDLHPRLGGMLKKSLGRKVEKLTMNSSSLLNRTEKDVPADELFFHKFFVKKAEKDRRSAKKRGNKERLEDKDFGGKGGSDDGSFEGVIEEDEEEEEEDDEDEGEGDEKEEEEVWKAMKASMGKKLQEEIEDGEDDESWLEDMDSEDFSGEDLRETKLDEDEDEGEESEIVFTDDDLEIDSDEDLKLLEQTSDEDEDEIQLKKRKKTGSKFDTKGEPEKKSKKNRKTIDSKTLRSLPIFAKLEEYSHLLKDDKD
ncbi:ribosome biogenesis protein [Phakopsora pachyrhizi]|uniref:Ribosome biogenesis protein n=1 Tax=Phakopsora pachyrhizi TaxID=170000 RepID=A0AAV0BMG9_PHAPC|nr:ribosome biogenesis protein [Phakopsora pachyrhizi]KAI8454884.1 ribosome biogenesis protein [Phakopsora pachyrhizi]CAH7687354.1 ribosome biogenesis protein [Phakopsora pachyrhizi]